MAIRKFSDYETTQTISDFKALPKGAYVLQIMGATTHENTNGQYIKIACDIAEGEFKGYFANDYRNQQENKKWRCNFLLSVPNDDGTEQDGWTKRKFKTVIDAIEKSNNGMKFNWAESWFKNKKVGGLFNEREYEKTDGTIAKATNLAQFITIEKLRSGEFKIPEDKILNKNNNRNYSSGGGVYNPSVSTAPQASNNNSWVAIPDSVIDDDLPFL